MVFSSILQNDRPKPKIFWLKWKIKHTLSIEVSNYRDIKRSMRWYSNLRKYELYRDIKIKNYYGMILDPIWNKKNYQLILWHKKEVLGDTQIWESINCTKKIKKNHEVILDLTWKVIQGRYSSLKSISWYNHLENKSMELQVSLLLLSCAQLLSAKDHSRHAHVLSSNGIERIRIT
jgi:hypothetical protein